MQLFYKEQIDKIYQNEKTHIPVDPAIPLLANYTIEDQLYYITEILKVCTVINVQRCLTQHYIFLN